MRLLLVFESRQELLVSHFLHRVSNVFILPFFWYHLSLIDELSIFSLSLHLINHTNWSVLHFLYCYQATHSHPLTWGRRVLKDSLVSTLFSRLNFNRYSLVQSCEPGAEIIFFSCQRRTNQGFRSRFKRFRIETKDLQFVDFIFDAHYFHFNPFLFQY